MSSLSLRLSVGSVLAMHFAFCVTGTWVSMLLGVVGLRAVGKQRLKLRAGLIERCKIERLAFSAARLFKRIAA